MNKKLFLLLPGFFILTGILCCIFIYKLPVSGTNDVVVLNRIAREAALNWENLEAAAYETEVYPFCITDTAGEILFKSSDGAADSLTEAAAKGYPVLEVNRDGQMIGRVIFTTSQDKQFKVLKHMVICAVLFFSAAGVLVSFCYYSYLEHTVIRPFKELKGFAKEVSAGNLDFPLTIRKNNLFGAFTESFDMLREQLLLAKEKEFKANQSQKELVASLSHDIKTPVTSIKLLSELLLELEQDKRLKTKVGMIYQKTGQIEELVDNLFSTTLQDLEQMSVLPEEIYSNVIKRLIRTADYRSKANQPVIPSCILILDELRFSQVLSNIFNNSYKYADTDISVEASVSGDYLKLLIRDSGRSLTEEELPLIFNKFYRGGNASKQGGSGLGLYICKKIMEQMQGDIYCICSDEGFMTVLLLKLA